MTILKTLFLGITLLAVNLAVAQEAENSGLFIQLKRADSIIFEQGFNKCNFPALQKIVHTDLEFLHDQGGIQNRDQFFRAVEQNICANPNAKPVRKLIPGSLKVYPLYNQGKLYGAIQMGDHEFYIAEPGKELRHTSTARFIHTWLLEGEQWKLYRVLSYDHH